MAICVHNTDPRTQTTFYVVEPRKFTRGIADSGWFADDLGALFEGSDRQLWRWASVCSSWPMNFGRRQRRS